MEFYQTNFAAFVLLNIVFAYREYRQSDKAAAADEKDGESRKLVEGGQEGNHAIKAFKWRFLPIYLLVNGADWLQVCDPREPALAE